MVNSISKIFKFQMIILGNFDFKYFLYNLFLTKIYFLMAKVIQGLDLSFSSFLEICGSIILDSLV